MGKHVEHLNNVLKAIQKAGLKLKITKFEFMRPMVSLLGHLVDKDSFKVD